jgi:hypothetical protein
MVMFEILGFAVLMLGVGAFIGWVTRGKLK